MKKISLYLFTLVFMTAFAACSGTQKTEAPAEQPVKSDTVATVATPQPVATDSIAPAKSPAELLKDFQAYAKSYGEAFNSMAKDPGKYQQLAAQSQKWVADMEKIKSQLNPAQLQAYKKACDIVIKVNKGGK
jgi:hypothetical protein